jgi:hypothetical protein
MKLHFLVGRTPVTIDVNPNEYEIEILKKHMDGEKVCVLSPGKMQRLPEMINATTATLPALMEAVRQNDLHAKNDLLPEP